MSISKLSMFTNLSHQKALGQFANIVKIALKDGVLTGDELKLIERMAIILEVTDEEFKNVTENPNKFPTNAPVSYDERIERLYYNTKMVLADGFVDTCEVELLQKIALKLHFDNKEISKESIRLVTEGNDLEDFTLAIKNLK